MRTGPSCWRSSVARVQEAPAVAALIVDDHPVYRLGLTLGLRGTPISIVGEAATGRAAVEQAKRLNPDVVLLDIGLPEGDGFAVCRTLRQCVPNAAVVMLSSYDDASTVRSSRLAGARGHLPKETPIGSLVDVLTWLVADDARMHFPDPSRLGLTDREIDVVEGLALGLQQGEIARRLGIGAETVKTYVRSVYEKLGVRDRAEALAVARTKKLIGAPPSRGYRP